MDSFTDTSVGWAENSMEAGNYGYYDDEYYQLTTNMAESVIYSKTGNTYDDVTVIGTTWDVNEESAGVIYGVGCRAQDNGNGYLFAVSYNNTVAILKMSEDGIEQLAEWTETDLLNSSGEANIIEGFCYGDYLRMRINGALALEANDSTWSSGAVEMWVTSVDTPPASAIFDDIIIVAEH
jgi:hypothetical protein